MSDLLDISSEVTSEEVIIEEIPLLAFRIIGCSVVTFLVGITVIIYVTAGMFHVDCFAQICCEISIFIAYMLILLTTTEHFKINTSMCLTISLFLHYCFVCASFFLLLEVMCMCQVLTTYFPKTIEATVRNVLLIGWLCPAVITGVSAIIWYPRYTTKKNCWLRMDQSPYWPTVIPIMFCLCLQIILMLVITLCPVSVSLPEPLYKRAKCYKTTKYASAIISPLLCLSWSFGVRAYHTGTETFYAAFTVSSIFMGVCILILRISTDEEVREKITTYVLCWLKPANNKVTTSTKSLFLTKKPFSEGNQEKMNGKMPSAEN